MGEVAKEAPRRGGVSLSELAGVTAGLGEGLPLSDVLRHEGVEPARWEEGQSAWEEAIAGDEEGSLQEAVDGALAAAQERYGREVSPLSGDVGVWIDFVRTFAASKSPIAFLAGLGLRAADVVRLHRAWGRRMAEDAAVREAAEQAMGRETRPLPEIAIGKRVIEATPALKDQAVSRVDGVAEPAARGVEPAARGVESAARGVEPAARGVEPAARPPEEAPRPALRPAVLPRPASRVEPVTAPVPVGIRPVEPFARGVESPARALEPPAPAPRVESPARGVESPAPARGVESPAPAPRVETPARPVVAPAPAPRMEPPAPAPRVEPPARPVAPPEPLTTKQGTPRTMAFDMSLLGPQIAEEIKRRALPFGHKAKSAAPEPAPPREPVTQDAQPSPLAKAVLPFRAAGGGAAAKGPPESLPVLPPAAKGAGPSLSGPALAGGVPVTVEQHAAMCAELAVFPGRAEAIFARHGLGNLAQRAAADKVWNGRLQKNPAEKIEWDQHYARYRAHFQRGG